ncbi:MAG: hypothetical protein DMF22_10305 [Verrucomicrobia bacterium]|nr:MAG: hypothetical protein DMF22_10305 [Verrucomicrobiota bacterium]
MLADSGGTPDFFEQATALLCPILDPHSRVKRRSEIDKIDTRVGKFFPIRKLLEVIAKIQPIH